MSEFTKLRAEFKTIEIENETNGNICSQSIGEKIRHLYNKIPSSGYPIKEEVIETYRNLNLEAREDLIYAIDIMIDNFRGHIDQWTEIKERIINDNGINRIK